MSRLLVLLAIVLIAYLFYQRLTRTPPHRRRAEYIKLTLAVVLIIAVVLTVTGRLHWVGAALTGLLVLIRQFLPALIRLIPMLSILKPQSAAAAGGGQQSTVESAILRMQLNHNSGQLTGEVLEGQYKGWYLEEMSKEQLHELLHYCQHQDQDSVQLLEGYLDQRFPGEESRANDSRDQTTSRDHSRAGMTQQEALAILGLQEDASEEDIVQAHRLLMQKMHPDRGGSDYLAAKINAAKDLLLGL